MKKFMAVALALSSLLLAVAPLRAATAEELNTNGRQALRALYNKNPKAAMIGENATAVLIFPHIVKAGFVFGAQGGEGVLFQNGEPVAYYRSRAASYGLQAGVQDFSYALFFMNRHALKYLSKSDGFELGVGPSFVMVDAGVAKTLSTTTLQSDIYAFIFDQQGLMAGLGLQGSRIKQIYPDN